MAKLAINGGKPIRKKLFPSQLTTGKEEARAAAKVIKHGVLSYFRGSWIPSFYGGKEIKKFEQAWSKMFHFHETVAVNSCTSALQIACGTIGIKPGDEVIVTPWSMSCSATAPMVYGGVPVFADIERDYFCLGINSIERKITKRTKAIIAVDLFGQPFNPAIMELAKKHGLWVIEDAAQAPGAYWINDKGYIRYTGAIGHIGCFSFTQGKHLTAGEGGAISINKIPMWDGLLFRAQLLRNHAEAVLSSDPSLQDISGEDNMLGFNMRMTEVQAAIMNVQIKKLSKYIAMREYNVRRINNVLSDLPGISPALVRPSCSHTYYVQAFHYYKEHIKGIHRDKFIAAVKAELVGEEKRVDRGVPIGCGYIQPLYRMPLFQEQKRKYPNGLCPTAEHLWKEELFTSMYHGLPLTKNDLQDFCDAFIKVYENLDELL